MDLMCWMDIETFKRIPHTEEKRRDLKAKDVKVKYLNKKYFFGPNSPAGKEGQELVSDSNVTYSTLIISTSAHLKITTHFAGNIGLYQYYMHCILQCFPLYLTTSISRVKHQTHCGKVILWCYTKNLDSEATSKSVSE